jgi:hypothetical protein
MKSFAFDIGDSTKQPLGAVMRITANNKAEAVKLANEVLDGLSWPTGHTLADHNYGVKGLEYVNIYLNPDFVLTEDDAMDEEEVDA